MIDLHFNLDSLWNCVPRTLLSWLITQNHTAKRVLKGGVNIVSGISFFECGKRWIKHELSSSCFDQKAEYIHNGKQHYRINFGLNSQFFTIVVSTWKIILNDLILVKEKVIQPTNEIFNSTSVFLEMLPKSKMNNWENLFKISSIQSFQRVVDIFSNPLH